MSPNEHIAKAEEYLEHAEMEGLTPTGRGAYAQVATAHIAMATYKAKHAQRGSEPKPAARPTGYDPDGGSVRPRRGYW